MRRVAVIIMLMFLAAAGTAFAFRSVIKDKLAASLKPALPIAEPYHPALPAEEAAAPDSAPAVPAEPTAKPSPAPTAAPAPGPTPAPKPPAANGSSAGANLAVPFTSQAPSADWSLPYQEACEEASLIMVNAFYKNAGAFTPADAESQIKALVAWENDRFGFYEDTNAEEVATMAKEYFGYANSRAIAISSIEDVKKTIDLGVPVLLPAAGRLLRNPNFSGAGPLYHMLVVKGYTKDGMIITDDPGTRRGADYLYDPAVLWNAVHDWNGGDVEHGRKVMVLVEK